MELRPEEISKIIRSQIKNYDVKINQTETGVVVLVGDGIASVYGLRNCVSTELLEFEDGSAGLALNLENDTVSVAILTDKNDIREGTKVKRTGTVLSTHRYPRSPGGLEDGNVHTPPGVTGTTERPVVNTGSVVDLSYPDSLLVLRIVRVGIAGKLSVSLC